MAHNNAPDPLQLDLEERKRQADMQNAQFIAQQMQLRMQTEMQTRGYLVKPTRDANGVWTGDFEPALDANGQRQPTVDAGSQSRTAALAEAQFEFNKSQSGLNYALQQQAQQIQQQQFAATQQYQQQQLAQQQQQFQSTQQMQQGQFESNAAFQQRQLDAQTAQRNAELSGYMNGGNTLARDQFLEQQAQNLANQTGYVGGQGGQGGQETLARQTQMAQLSGYLNGQNTLARDQFGEQQRQFNVGTVMNAPTSPVDIPAYLNRLRGLNNQGMVPGIIGQFLGGGQVAAASDGGINTPPPISRSQLALELTGQGGSGRANGLPTGPNPYGNEWGSSGTTAPSASGTPGMSWEGRPAPDPSQPKPTGAFGGNTSPYGNESGAAPAMSSEGRPVDSSQPRPTGIMSTNGGSPYGNEWGGGGGGSPYGGGPTPTGSFGGNGTGSSPYGGGQGSAAMQRFLSPLSEQGDPSIASSRTWSPTSWEKLSPTEQQYTLGLNQEFNGEPVADAQSNISKSAPHFRQSRIASFAGIG